MARVHLLLCFTLLFASVTLLDVASAFLKLKPSLPQIKDPKTVGEVESYTVEVVTIFVGNLEKECPKTSKFKMFFDFRGFAKYVCPLKIFGKKDDADMKTKEAGILKTIVSFAIGRIKSEIQEEKQEAIETFKFMKSLAGRILGGRKKEEKETTTLTPEQLKEIKDGILKWQTVIVKVANTMVTTEVTVTEVETQTSEQVMIFLMNLEKKCPPKEEYKQFFEKLKSTMAGSAKVSSPKKKGGLFAMIKGAVGKIGDAMQFIRSRIGNKSAEVKKSMETYQAEVIKNMEELNAIYAKIVTQNQSKKGGAMTCTPEQQAEIKTTITKWEQVTTQFVEVAIKSETSTATSTSTSSSTGTAQAN
ncbi:hypothetical protein Bca101_006841 [Brassica carinata]